MKKLTTFLAAAVIAASASTSVAALPSEGVGTEFGRGVKPTPNVPVPQVPPTSDGKFTNLQGTNAICVGVSWDVASTNANPYLYQLATEPKFPSLYGSAFYDTQHNNTQAVCIGVSWDVGQPTNGGASYPTWPNQPMLSHSRFG
ncbi:hypothetical protein OCT63_20780 [Vibrio sp. RW]|uniref:hypothetical protein n=1 Tax=Vibrio sp. RW TaxID=2998833 RepID=UPI0022CD263A|nr:hypothetical protein [Vibrio sp. RW]MDA0146650.1 hypothetical protein [Vibrio sp. RW]